MNIPNLLSMLRILLIPVFGYVYMNAQTQPWYTAAAVLLLVSGLTDLVDGFLARRWGQVTQLGKILDPVADKLTQAVVCVLLGIRMPEFRVILWLFIIKELVMLVAGVRLYRRNKSLDGSRWFGKLYTVVFYVIMLLIIGLPSMKGRLVMTLLVVMALFMLFAFLMYVPVFLRLNRTGAQATRKRT